MSMEINITIVLFNITIVSGFYKYNYSLHVLSRVLSRVLPRGLSCGLPRGRPSPRGLQGSPLRSPAATWAAKGSACYLYRMLFIASWSLSVLSRFMCSYICSFSHFDCNFRHGFSRFKTEKASGSNANSLQTPSVFHTFSTDNLSFCNQFHAFQQPYMHQPSEKTQDSPVVPKEFPPHDSK